MELDSQIRLGHLLLSDRECRVCGENKNLIDGFYLTRKERMNNPTNLKLFCAWPGSRLGLNGFVTGTPQTLLEKLETRWSLTDLLTYFRAKSVNHLLTY